MDIEIIKGYVSKDHVHLFVSVSPQRLVSKVMQKVKGIFLRKMLMEFKALPRQFWGRYLWVRGYFVASSGNVTDEVMMKYIEEQELDKPNDDFKIDDKK